MRTKPLPPRILAIHDICGVGRCSLVSAISILSHLGSSVCPLATASFATNTTYPNFLSHDLSNTLIPFIDDFHKRGIKFESLYSGYLGSERQPEAILKAMSLWPSAYKVIDPVFADGGTLYSHFTRAIVDSFRELIKGADLITPNITEASYLLTGDPDQLKNLKEAEEALLALSDNHTKNVIITSVEDAQMPGKLGIIAFDKKSRGRFEFFSDRREGVNFCGTGDVMTSAVLGLLLAGHPFEGALRTAFEFITDAIDYTLDQKGDVREGIVYEPSLRRLG